MKKNCLPALLGGKPFDAVRSKAVELLDWLGLSQRRSHLPSRLSGGEMQRTAIARALINDPKKRIAKVTGPCNLTFPEDHGAHPEYRTEWWYYTGILSDADGRRFGFQLTFFRSALQPAAESGAMSAKKSCWRTRQVYMAHAAITDIEAGRHWSDEKAARGAMGMAGVTREDERVRVTLLDWHAVIEPQVHRLRAAGGMIDLNLQITPTVADQEMATPQTTQVTYWEGSVQVQGRFRDQAVQGVGYVELTGYAQPFEAPM